MCTEALGSRLAVPHEGKREMGRRVDKPISHQTLIGACLQLWLPPGSTCKQVSLPEDVGMRRKALLSVPALTPTACDCACYLP